MTNQKTLKLALEALVSYGKSPYIKQSHPKRWANGNKAIKALEEALAKQEQGDPLPDFYITERTADSIYKLKSRDWALCISGNKGPTMHKNIPVFVGYIKTKPVEQEQGEIVAWVCNGVNNTHDIDFDENEINDLPVGTMLYTTPQQRKPLTDEQIGDIAKNYALNNPTTPLHFARAIEAAHGIKE